MTNSSLPPKASSTILAIILSGGAGRRFGGVDKGLQLYQGKSLVERTIEVIRPQVEALVICINRNEPYYSKLGYPLVFDSADVPDKSVDYQGPLAGIVAAYEWLQSNKHTYYSHVLISSCDSPKLPSDYVAKLLNALDQNARVSAVVNDGERNQNLHCLIPSKALPNLVTFFNEGGRAMHRWHKKNGLIEVNFSDQADCFSNFNFSEQLIDL